MGFNSAFKGLKYYKHIGMSNIKLKEYVKDARSHERQISQFYRVTPILQNVWQIVLKKIDM